MPGLVKASSGLLVQIPRPFIENQDRMGENRLTEHPPYALPAPLQTPLWDPTLKAVVREITRHLSSRRIDCLTSKYNPTMAR